MNLFSIDGKLFKALIKAGDFFILGFLGFVFSIPIVTAGASLTAMFYAGMKLVRDEESYVFRDFMRSWKRNLLQSFIIELLAAAAAALLLLDLRICYRWANVEGSMFGRMLLFVSIGLMLVLAAVVLYVFPLLAKFDNTVMGTVRNALILCMHHFPQTLIMLFITGGLIYFSLYYFTAFIVTIPLICYIDSYILARVLLQYAKKDNAEPDENTQNAQDEDTQDFTLNEQEELREEE